MSNWINICSVDDLVVDSGVAAKVNNAQIAIFYVPSQKGKVFAVSNWDPVAEANVIARGLVCDSEGQMYVASPIYKERYDLKTGQCLDDDRRLKTWQVKLEGSKVLLAS